MYRHMRQHCTQCFFARGGLGGPRKKNKLCTVLARMSIRLFIAPNLLRSHVNSRDFNSRDLKSLKWT